MRLSTIYILLLFVGLLSGCTNELDLSTDANDERVEINFQMECNDFEVATRAVDETIKRIDLLVFDKDGKLLEKVPATNINTLQRTFKATVLAKAKIIHFIANYATMDSFDAVANINRTEHEIVPALNVNNNELVFWGRTLLTNINSARVELIRNQAKVSVTNNILNSSISLKGFDVCNYSVSGSIAPYINNLFEYSPNVVTGSTSKFRDGISADNNDDKYICEYRNLTTKETFVILRFDQLVTTGGTNSIKQLYFKVFLRDANNTTYPIVRNVNYRIIVKKIPTLLAASTFADAVKAPPINSLYAEVMRESPSVSDNDGNILKVWPITYLLKQKGSVNSKITAAGKLGNVTCDILNYDAQSIISDLTFDNTGVKANVKAVTVQTEAQIRVKYGVLERIITVIATPEYLLTSSASPMSYTKNNTEIVLNFNLDNNYPSASDYPDLYPIRCYIKAPNLNPVDNRNMFIDFNYIKGEYWYTYLAQKPGLQTIKFKTNFNTVTNDSISIQSRYFNNSVVVLNKK